MPFQKIFFIALIVSSSFLFGEFTFKVDDVEVATKPLPKTSPYEIAFRKYGKVEDFGEHEGKLVYVTYHPFVETIYRAYRSHYPVSISPDHIWLLICQGLSCHINQDPEKYRAIMVNHQGKKDIVVIRNDFVKGSLDNDWEGVFPEFCEKMEKFMTPYAKEMLITKFSTTGHLEQAAFDISMMETMQNYFSYLLVTLCGIPEITLEGEVEDWELILKKVDLLDKVGLEWWTKELRPVIQEFVDAAKGKPNLKFWKSFCKDESLGSGSHFVTGKVNYFFPYLQTSSDKQFYRNPIFDSTRELKSLNIDLPAFPDGMSTAPFIWKYLGKDYTMKFMAGFVAAGQNSESMTLRPEIGWFVQEHKMSKGSADVMDCFFKQFEKVLPELMESVTRMEIVDATGDQEESITVTLTKEDVDEFCQLFYTEGVDYSSHLQENYIGKINFNLYMGDIFINSFQINEGMIASKMPGWLGTNLNIKTYLAVCDWAEGKGLKRLPSYANYLYKHSEEKIDTKKLISLPLLEFDTLRKERYSIQKKFLSQFFTKKQLENVASIFKESKLNIEDKIAVVYWCIDEYEKYGVFFNKTIYEAVKKENRNITQVSLVKFFIEGEKRHPLYDKISKRLLSSVTSYRNGKAFKNRIPEGVYNKLCSKLARTCCENGTIWDDFYFFCRLENKSVRYEFVTALFKLINKMNLESIDEDKIWDLNYYFFMSADGYKIMSSKFSEEEICTLKFKWLEYCTKHNKYLEEALKFGFKGNYKYFLKEFIKKADSMKEKPDYYNFMKKASRMTIFESYSEYNDAFILIRGIAEEVAAEDKLYEEVTRKTMYQNMVADSQGKNVVDNAKQFWKKVEVEFGEIWSYNRNFIVVKPELDKNGTDDVYYLLNSQGERIFPEAFLEVNIYPDYYKYLDSYFEGYDSVEPVDLPLDHLENGRVIAVLTDQKSKQFVIKVNNGTLVKETVSNELVIEKIVDDKLLFSDNSNLIGIMDHNFTTLRKPKYSDVYWFSEGLCGFEIDFAPEDKYGGEKYGYFDMKLNEVIEARLENGEDFYKGRTIAEVDVGKSLKYGLIDRNGDFVIPPTYDWIWWKRENEFYSVQKDSKWGVIDKTGKVIVTIKYPVEVEWIDGYTVINFGGKYGLLDQKGKPVNFKVE